MATSSLEINKPFESEIHLFQYKIYVEKSITDEEIMKENEDTLIIKDHSEHKTMSKKLQKNGQINKCSFAHLSIDFSNKSKYNFTINTIDSISEINERVNISSTDVKHLPKMNDVIYKENFSFNTHKNDESFLCHFNYCLVNPRKNSYYHYLIFDFLGEELSKLVYKNTEKIQLFIECIGDEKDKKLISITQPYQESLIKEDIDSILLIKNDNSICSKNFKDYRNKSNTFKADAAYRPYEPQEAKYLEYILIYKYSYV